MHIYIYMYMFIRIYTHTLNRIYVRVQFSVCGAVRTFKLRGRSPWPNEMRRRPRTSNGLAARLGPGALRRCGQLVPGSPAVLPRPRHSSCPPPRSQGCGPGQAGSAQAIAAAGPAGRPGLRERALDGQARAAPAAIASSALSAGGCEEGFLAASPPASPGGSPKGSRPDSPVPTPQAPRVDLQGAELWKRFHEIGTEMIITKAGR